MRGRLGLRRAGAALLCLGTWGALDASGQVVHGLASGDPRLFFSPEPEPADLSSHRREIRRTVNGVVWINASKATNVDAAARSIESFDKVVAIIGGKYKGGDFTDLAAPLRAHGRAVVAIGEARPMVKAALKDVVPVLEAASLAEAVRRAWDLAAPDGVVLLAPACSSFDMFTDYADRGRQFKEEVRKLIQGA